MRTHKQQVEAAKTIAWESRHPEVNNMGFAAAWKTVASIDPGLPKQPAI